MLGECAGIGIGAAIGLLVGIIILLALVKGLLDVLRFGRTKRLVAVDKEPTTAGSGEKVPTSALLLSAMIVILAVALIVVATQL